ncbi:MAG: hypothetical protein MPJ50_03290 [Pirellulales bacterium]|nr:hypothetical protein [Pirellulales bacterium]
MFKAKHTSPFHCSVAALLSAIVVITCGCEDDTTSSNTPAAPGGGEPARDSQQPTASDSAENTGIDTASKTPPIMAETLPPAEIVKVQLAERDAATCLVKQGDQFPNATLTNHGGQQLALADTYGNLATILLVWDPDDDRSVQLLSDVVNETAGKHTGINLTVVDIGEDGRTATNKLAGLSPVEKGFQALHDGDRSLYAQIATGPAPRLYVLDSQGKVLWFCIDDSIASFKEFQAAIRFLLQSVEDPGK